MEIKIREIKGISIIDISFGIIARGKLMSKERFELSIVLEDTWNKTPGGIIVNLENVALMDTVVLGNLTAIHTRLLKQNGKLVLLNAGRSIHYLLVVSKLDQLFEKYDDEEEAVESFGKKVGK